MKKQTPFPIQFANRIKNINHLFEEQSSFGQKMADRVATIIGSWPFILVQCAILVLWVGANVTAFINHWDPYPFILMNLVLSLQSALTAPIIMMSQNRQAEKDHLDMQQDFIINKKSAETIELLQIQLQKQQVQLDKIELLLQSQK